MAVNIIKRTWHQNQMVKIEPLNGFAFQAESGGHTFQISGVDDSGNAVPISGTIAGVFLRPDNTDVALTGSASGGMASVTLKAECYAVPGRFLLTVYATSGSNKGTIYAAMGTVSRTSSGAVSPAAASDVVDLVNRINAATATIPASYTTLLNAVATDYSPDATYPKVGTFVWYSGKLYRSKVPITTAETWTAAHWNQVVLSDALNQDITDLKSAVDSYYDWKEVDSGTLQGSGGSQAAEFSPTMVVGKKYKVIVTTTQHEAEKYVRLRIGMSGNMLLIGTIPAGETQMEAVVVADAEYSVIRVSETIASETYSYAIYEESFLLATEEELDAVEENVSDLLSAVDALGYDSENYVQYTETTDVDTTLTSGYVAKDGTVHDSESYYYTAPIIVNEGDVISGATTDMFRFLCARDENGQSVVDSGMSVSFSSYTVPAGIKSVIVTVYSNKASYNIAHTKSYNQYVTPQKPLGYFRATGNLNDGDKLNIPITNIKKNTIIAFEADITSFEKLRIGRTNSSDEYAYLEIDNTNITVVANGVNNTVIPHGLTITNNIQVRIIQNTNGINNPTTYYRGFVELSSNGSMFKTTDINTLPQTFWTRSSLPIFAESVGSVLTNCALSFVPCDALKKIYMFGDSYFSFYTERWTYYFVQNGYDKNVLLNAYPGENSQNAVKALMNLLSLGTIPTYMVWCLGMNDGGDSSSAPSDAWVTGRDAFLGQCKKYGIIPVFGTIPSVPNKSNEKKNEWIRSSGYQYIDFAKAVGAQADGTWYSGMLSTDNVHPTVAGGIALYGRVLTDFPQIAYSN